MRVAGIDIGSNTSLLLVMEKTPEGFEVLSDEIYFTRLAENIERTSCFSESALIRLESAFSTMRKILDFRPVDFMSIVATSASRQAKNKNRLFELGEKYNLSPIKIISPQKEAHLTFIGAFFGLGCEPRYPLVVDIGGGSTELISPKSYWSLRMGSVSLTENFLSLSGLTSEERQNLSRYIQQRLKPLESFLKEDYTAVIFTAGTPTTLAFMEKETADSNHVHGLLLTEDKAQFWLEKLSTMSVEERKDIPYLPEHRADVIVAGLSLLTEILKKTGKKEFIVSATGVRYGLALERFQMAV